MSRVIAGSLASQHLVTPTGSNTRPTTDRVREAVFAGLSSWW
ncbi:MAG: RsmD family RNA methyltransferase, partial [Propionibacteriaceae bacterium]|nr:RsmD family RNA methyltransferase [Propionibacteriaceae bacterium]